MIKHIVFDFDGTLVKSDTIKRECFFGLFSHIPNSDKVVASILDKMPDESRTIVIPLMLKDLGLDESLAEQYITLYGEETKRAQGTCKQLTGAERLLTQLSDKYILHLSSNTLESDLLEVIKVRNWKTFFRTISGHPNKKSVNLKKILKDNNLLASEVCVVGDGVSDRESASAIGCLFHQINGDNLYDVMKVYL